MTVTTQTTYSSKPWAEASAAANATTDALVNHVIGPTPGVIPPTVSPTSPDIANSATITPTYGRMRYTPTAARTGLIIAPGTVDGQLFILQNDAGSTFTMTFAAAATSNVVDGTSAALPIQHSWLMVWDAASARWQHTG